jgi:hypothetical protein
VVGSSRHDPLLPERPANRRWYRSNRGSAGKLSLALSVRDTARERRNTTDGDEERCETPEELSRIVAQYQLEHPDDPNLRRISVARRSRGTDERLPAQQFLPEQIP